MISYLNNILKLLDYIYHDNKNVDDELITFENIDIIKDTMLLSENISINNSFKKIIEKCLAGNTILLVNGFNKALIISTIGWERRGITEPTTEVVVRGPKEGFTETLRSNTTLLRRKIHNPDLKIESLIIGQRTNTNIAIAYIKELANEKLVKELKSRLNKINTDSILESGYIEELIEDAPLSPFSTIGNSEKPDKVAAKILEGRIAILVDGTPFVLTIPKLFIENFQSVEDYYSRPFLSSLIRFFRYIAFLISMTGPAIYVALTNFHQETIPTPLVLTMASSKEGIPFPGVLEALLMVVTFELLREAGINVGLLGLLIHLSSLRSFGSPFLSPLAPVYFKNLKDSFVRFPLWSMHTRPVDISHNNPKRQDFLESTINNSQESIASLIHINKKGDNVVGISLSGTAVFKNNKLKTFLDTKETRGLLWINNKIKSGIINVNGNNKDDKISFEIIRSKSKIEAVINNPYPYIKIYISELGNIVSTQTYLNLSSKEEIQSLKNRKATAIYNEVKSAIDKTQEINCDIFGFGNYIYKKHPGEWKKIKNNWDNIFPILKTEIYVETKIKRSGTIIEPIFSQKRK